jgi:hypothetical protein
MNPDMSSAPAPMPQGTKKSNTPIIIAVIVLVVLCLCCAVIGGAYYLYQNGDRIFGTGLLLMQSL